MGSRLRGNDGRVVPAPAPKRMQCATSQANKKRRPKRRFEVSYLLMIPVPQPARTTPDFFHQFIQHQSNNGCRPGDNKNN